MKGEEKVLSFDLEVTANSNLLELRLTVSNTGKERTSFIFPTSQEHDFALVREGQTIWRWSAERVFAQAFHTLSLNPGQICSYKGKWNYTTLLGERIKPGSYLLQGYFLGVSRSEPVVSKEFIIS